MRERETYKNIYNDIEKFKRNLSMPLEDVLEIVADQQRVNKKEERPIALRRAIKKTREEEVNETRQIIIEAIRTSPPNTSNKKIAAIASCHTQTVTGVLQ